jgi:uncharacterized membrane protein
MPTPQQQAWMQQVFGVGRSKSAAPGAGAAPGAPPPGVLKGPNDPVLDPAQFQKAAAQRDAGNDLYLAALQGTSSRQSKPEVAEKLAREVGFKAQQAFADNKAALDVGPTTTLFQEFADALSGTAGQFDNADKIVKEAVAITFKVKVGEPELAEAFDWKNATLPQPMAADCAVVRGKVPGPKNHVLCGSHYHVLDTDAQTVIAHSVEEYKQLFGKGKSAAPSAGAAPGAPPPGGLKGPNDPVLDPAQFQKAAAERGSGNELYLAALQGTSSRQSKPEVAEKLAREVAFKAQQALEDNKAAFDIGPAATLFKEYADALSGTAGKFDDADKIVKEAVAITLKVKAGEPQLAEAFDWKNATLPQPMAGDCAIVRGKVPGPKNHVLCGTHYHVLDTDAQTVIAHSVAEYKQLFGKGK